MDTLTVGKKVYVSRYKAIQGSAPGRAGKEDLTTELDRLQALIDAARAAIEAI